ncbi:flippase-like domain-containing protein [bacterium]|nr:flippase-like domain-containing protein [bacterium]
MTASKETTPGFGNTEGTAGFYHRHKHGIQFVVGGLLSLVALYFVFRGVSFREILGAITSFDYVWLAPALVSFYFGIWLRAARWKWLFLPRYDVSLKHATGGIFIGFALNSVYPARAGEFARAYLIGRQEKTGFSTAFGTVVSERFLDLLMMPMLWLAAVLFAGRGLIGPEAELRVSIFGAEHVLTGERFIDLAWGLVPVAVALMVGILAFTIPYTRGGMLWLAREIPYAPRKWREKIAHLMESFSQGFGVFRSPTRLIGLIVFTAIIWFTNALSVYLLARGFDFQNVMTIPQSMALIVIICVFITIPAAPGYWGFFEAGVIFSIVIMGIHGNDSLVRSFAILVHLTQWVPIVAIGLPWAWMSHVSVGEAEAAGEHLHEGREVEES